MKCILLFLSCICLSSGLFAQDYIKYHNLVNEAEYCLFKKEYYKAQRLYLKAFEEAEPFGKDAYLLAKSYAFSNDQQATYDWLIRAASAKVSYLPFLLEKTSEQQVFKKVFEDDQAFYAILEEIRDLREIKRTAFATENTLLRESLNDIIELRYQLSPKHISDSLKILKQQFLKLCQDYNYPGYYLVGSNIGSMMLSGLDDSLYKQFDPILKSALKKGHILPFTYGYMQDQYYAQEDSCHLSMLYTKDFCENKDWEGLVKKRLEMGLSIYFKGSRRKGDEDYELLPWVEEAFTEQYSYWNRP